MIESLKGKFWDCFVIEGGRRLVIGRINPVVPERGSKFENDVFATDAEALAYVEQLARDGNEEAREALMMVAVSEGEDEESEGLSDVGEWWPESIYDSYPPDK